MTKRKFLLFGTFGALAVSLGGFGGLGETHSTHAGSGSTKFQPEVSYKQRAANRLEATRKAFEAGNYERVIELTENFQNPGGELGIYVNQARVRLSQNQPESRHKDAGKYPEEVAKLTRALRRIPVAQYQENLWRYTRLVELRPDNQRFREKRDFYRKKYNAKQLTASLTALKQSRVEVPEQTDSRGEKPVRSSYDGNVWQVKAYLQKVANDPDSIELAGCTKVQAKETGWLVGCHYRGKNAFGGLVKQFHWFLIRNNNVVDTFEAGASRLSQL